MIERERERRERERESPYPFLVVLYSTLRMGLQGSGFFPSLGCFPKNRTNRTYFTSPVHPSSPPSHLVSPVILIFFFLPPEAALKTQLWTVARQYKRLFIREEEDNCRGRDMQRKVWRSRMICRIHPSEPQGEGHMKEMFLFQHMCAYCASFCIRIFVLIEPEREPWGWLLKAGLYNKGLLLITPSK